MKTRTISARSIAVFVWPLLLLVCRPSAIAQTAPDPGSNAALQYYSAFLQMRDADLNDGDVKELGEIMAGNKPYDEAKFGALVEKNSQAVETMMIGSELPYCQWGLAQLGQKFGPATPVPYFWRSRVLWRLDYLYVLRLAGQGKQEEAVHALAAGLKFGRQIPNGGPLVPALIAMTVLREDLALANRWLDSSKLTPAQKDELRSTLDVLGSDGIDWQSAVKVEMQQLKIGLDWLKAKPDQRQYYKVFTNEDSPADFKGVTAQDYADLAKVTEAFTGMFRDSNPAPVWQAMNSSTHFVHSMIPNPTKVLDSRDAVRKVISDTRARLAK